jgi:hypothetical protein
LAAAMAAEVLAMGLTWRDLVSSVAAIAMVLAYVSFAYGTRIPLLSSAWSASAVELVLGAFCAVTVAADLHLRPQERLGVIFRRITTVLGTIALLAGLAGMVTNSRHLVEIVVVVTGFLWLTACIWHVLSIGSEQ